MFSCIPITFYVSGNLNHVFEIADEIRKYEKQTYKKYINQNTSEYYDAFAIFSNNKQKEELIEDLSKNSLLNIINECPVAKFSIDCFIDETVNIRDLKIFDILTKNKGVEFSCIVKRDFKSVEQNLIVRMEEGNLKKDYFEYDYDGDPEIAKGGIDE